MSLRGLDARVEPVAIPQTENETQVFSLWDRHVAACAVSYNDIEMDQYLFRIFPHGSRREQEA